MEDGTLDSKEYHEWKSLTFNFLFPVSGRATLLKSRMETSEIIVLRNTVYSNIWRAVRSYVTRSRSTEVRGNAKRDLEEIVWAAMRLDVDFKKHKVDFSLPRWGTRACKDEVDKGNKPLLFDSEKMTAYSSHRQSSDVVELIIQPALIRNGDSSGTNYENQRVLLPAQVICEDVVGSHEYVKRRDSKNTLQKRASSPARAKESRVPEPGPTRVQGT